MLTLSALIIALVVCSPALGSASSALTSRTEVIAPSTHQELNRIFQAHEYTWDTLEEGAPPLILKSLPGDLETIPDTDRRKKVFFLSLLPMVLLGNEEISRQRSEIVSILNRQRSGAPLREEEKVRLLEIARDYGIDQDPLQNRAAQEELLKRVDTLPPALVLAQAATESGYGTSRFALLGNNIFGEWTFTPGTGIVPRNRPEGETYEVRHFPTLYESLRSYMKNLNTHRAYRSLRAIRASLRAEERPVHSAELARGLINYSTRREAYIREIRAIIRGNRLSRLSEITLRKPPPSGSAAGLLSTAHLASRDYQPR